MIAVTDQKGLLILIKPKGQHLYRLACIGRKSHYRKDGTCKHTETVLAHMTPWHRARTRVDPFGGKTSRPTPRNDHG